MSAAMALDTNFLNLLIKLSVVNQGVQYRISLFYHPFVRDFIRSLNLGGVDGWMQRQLQLSNNSNFANDYAPVTEVVQTPYAHEDVDFDDGGLSIYNWELFLHTPLMIAECLSQNQKFEGA